MSVDILENDTTVYLLAKYKFHYGFIIFTNKKDSINFLNSNTDYQVISEEEAQRYIKYILPEGRYLSRDWLNSKRSEH